MASRVHRKVLRIPNKRYPGKALPGKLHSVSRVNQSYFFIIYALTRFNLHVGRKNSIGQVLVEKIFISFFFLFISSLFFLMIDVTWQNFTWKIATG